MDLVWWYASRTSGIVSAVAMLGAVVGGMSFSARNTGTSVRPAWWLRSHNWLAVVAVVSTVLHLVAVYIDGSYGIGLADLVLPGVTPWALSWGVIASYLLVAGVATSWPRRRLSARWWRMLHLGLVVSTVAAAIHGVQSGTDATNGWWRLLLQAGAGVLTFVVLARVLLGLLDRYVRRERTRVSASQTLAAPERPGPETRERRANADLDERVTARLASTAGPRGESATSRPGRTVGRAAVRPTATADRARALAILGATGVMAAAGSWIASVNETPTGRPGSVLGQPPRGAADFDGERIDTPFGPVQVRARFVNGRLIDIVAPGAPSSIAVSREISAASVPTLRSEALQAQTAEVDAVSGASYTSAAYRRSLQSAIDRARAADATTIR